MIRCPRPGEPTPWDPFPKPKPGGIVKTIGEIIKILTGKK